MRYFAIIKRAAIQRHRIEILHIVSLTYTLQQNCIRVAFGCVGRINSIKNEIVWPSVVISIRQNDNHIRQSFRL